MMLDSACLELLLIFRKTLIHDEVGGKLALAAELARLEQRDQVVQLVQDRFAPALR